MARAYAVRVGSQGTVLFDAQYATAGLTNYDSVIHAERISIVNDPVLGASRKVAQLHVFNTDTGPTINPRAQMEAPYFLNINGGEYWIGFCVLFPTGFPSGVTAGMWVTLESCFGPPFGDAGSPRRTMLKGTPINLTWERTSDESFERPFNVPIQLDHWYDFVVHTRLSNDPNVGYVEYYLNSGTGWNAVQLTSAFSTVTNGGTRLWFASAAAGSNDGGDNNSRLTFYRTTDLWDEATMYFGHHKVGTSFDVVAPASY